MSKVKSGEVLVKCRSLHFTYLIRCVIGSYSEKVKCEVENEISFFRNH